MADPFSGVSAFLRELRERRVFRVALVYGVVAWALIEVASTVTEPLRLPSWLPTLVIVLVALGFPLALLLAWAFELTPDGLRRSSDVAAARPQNDAAPTDTAAPAAAPTPARSRGASLAAGVGIGILIAIVGLGAYATLHGRADEDDDAAGRRLGRSIVVLPFDNMSDEEGSTHFADGVTEEITAALAGIGDLSVTSRTSAMRYRDSDRTIAEIARELGVDVVLEGSVRRSGGMVRITAQLIDGRTDEHVWAESWDRELTADAFFEVQSDIARRIATQLHATLSPDERDAIERRPTTNLLAYELYVEATRDLDLRGGSGVIGPELRQRIALLRRALEMDPEFALARAHLAEMMMMTGFLFSDPAWADSASRQVDLAFATDSTLPEVWYLKAEIADLHGDIETAEGAMRHALELRPSFAAALARLGSLVGAQGRYPEAIELILRAWRLEPTQPQHAFELGNALLQVGDVERAAVWMRRAQRAGLPTGAPMRGGLVDLALMRGDTARAFAELDSLRSPPMQAALGDVPAYWELLGDLSVSAGQDDHAIAHYARQRALLGDDPDMTFTGLALVHRRRGNVAESDRLLNEAEIVARRILARAPIDGHLRLAMVEAVRGNGDQAVAHLERALEEGYTITAALAVNPRFRLLEGHPRYDAVMRDLERERARARERIASLNLD